MFDGGDPALHPDRYAWRNPICGAQLPELMATFHPGFLDDDLLRRIAASADNWCAPGVLRAQGERILGERILADGDDRSAAEAEALFRRSMTLAGAVRTHDHDRRPTAVLRSHKHGGGPSQ
ncbi:hypothetical protein [Thalassobaculum litoreum]|uniref:Uncharacterized protein n=1 Tax=Thalassobaculum litoreum DSM 18839 TaxID=1123362 RepID=A0A8G2BII1_9PROT|nr:hypothetical protein [Thalassobaculum litoreum]SDF89137.1 hypothetical protein SAMN05660686_02710 [Thalassobaculum litoreum DSM 18839]